LDSTTRFEEVIMLGKAKRLAGATVSFLGLVVAFAPLTGAHAQGACGGALTDWSDGNTTWQVQYANGQGALVTATIVLGAAPSATVSPAQENGATTGNYFMGSGYIFFSFTAGKETVGFSFGSPVCVAGGTTATAATTVAITDNGGTGSAGGTTLGTGIAVRLTP
jgi:hypothetical protein